MSQAVLQRGLFGTDYAVSPDCTICEKHITGDVYKDPDGEDICSDCFDLNGYAICPECSETFDKNDLIENPNGDDWCQNCIDDNCFECDNCGNIEWDDERTTVSVRRGYRSEEESACRSCAEDTLACSDCGNSIYSNDAIEYAGYEYICECCYEQSYHTCDSCGRIIHHDDSYCTDSGIYCENCRSCYGEDFDPSGFSNSSGSLTDIGSARCFGVELETDGCDGYIDLKGSGAWGAKDDCTVSGKEFFSAILNGDDGLEAIEEWGNLADRNGWDAGSSAGYHLHLDMRNESDDSLYAIAYAYRVTERVWFSFVPRRRHSGTYSCRIRWNASDIDASVREGSSFYTFTRGNDRYQWCNITAYNCHSTFEIRLHHGTCDSEEVINWVKAHTRFADWASDLGYEGVKEVFEEFDWSDANGLFLFIIREIWKDYPLSDYYANKARHYNHGWLTSSIGCEEVS